MAKKIVEDGMISQYFFFQAEDGIRDYKVTGVQTCALPIFATSNLKANMAALQFAVDTIQKHKVQPPGVMGWNDASNNEAYMAGKLVTTNNGASLYYAMGAKKHPLFEKTQVVLTPGGPAGSFVFAGAYNWGVFQKSKHHELAEDLIRW